MGYKEAGSRKDGTIVLTNSRSGDHDPIYLQPLRGEFETEALFQTLQAQGVDLDTFRRHL